MTTGYDGDSSAPETIDNSYLLIVDGDAPAAAVWRVPAEQMADNIAKLDARTGNPGADTITRVLDDGFVFETDATGLSYWDVDAAMAYAEQLDVTGAVRRGVRMRLNLPDGAEVDRIKVWIVPPTGHGALPANMPRWRLLSQVPGNITLTPTVLHTETDASASVGAYETAHYIDDGGGLGIPINRSTSSYWLSIEGEGDTNAIVGLRAQLCAVVTFLPALVDRGAG